MAAVGTGGGIRELLEVILLSITAVVIAWSGFESSQWDGQMTIAFSQASTARLEATREAARADAARGFDLTVFGIYVQAVASGDKKLSDFVEQRFTDHFAVAFRAWQAQKPLENPNAPKGPFSMPEYRPPGQAEAAAADIRADKLFRDGLTYDQHGDHYTLLTVLFALVLFFTAISGRIRAAWLAWTVMASATVLMVVGVVLLAVFPKIL